MSTDQTGAPAPQGDYRAALVHDGVVYTAGMTPRVNNELSVRGVVGATLSVQQAHTAAGIAAANALAAARSVLPAGVASDRIRCLRMTVYIACAPTFHALSAVADGASARIRAELGADALPVRAAIGVQTLPSGAPVEIDLIAAVF
ncbi:enamine deaminase RidA (YjgF/YER057c/UK114 family) [Mycobacterium frederiksbergense]|uniref:Enamine deaminase RidA (YjgF/YER057c/UK114 family) n=1 Tax=Mycolicibacterium frederiksbergense TaxID=117567 RepID=A0ABT6L4H3_9MYCO|nr:RidA family protein [Mycolicibacterium frederiksbergense]MDH6197849.1 enamine deaminase RidA (YjgF/YER057c/UK114 family) [Mycolicibacterium frederiksbergense]